MFDKLEDLLVRFEELMGELQSPGVTDNQVRFRALMKEQSDLAPIVDTYKEYKKANDTIKDSLELLEAENDEEMREMLKEELNEAKKNVEELEQKLKILLVFTEQQIKKFVALKFQLLLVLEINKLHFLDKVVLSVVK